MEGQFLGQRMHPARGIREDSGFMEDPRLRYQNEEGSADLSPREFRADFPFSVREALMPLVV